MKLATFFEKFDQFADAPDAVAKMRRLILHIALRGKLVSPCPTDTPASVSFSRLLNEAIEAPDDDYPRHWQRIPLGDMGEWRGGGTPSKSRPDYWMGDIPWVSPKDMKVLHVSDAQDHISKLALDSCSARLIPAGSLIMVVRGMILAHTFPVGLTTREVTINQDMKAVLPFYAETKDFLLLALRSLAPSVLATIERSTHGTCKLDTDILKGLTIPLPPLAEQKRIVAKVDELMALCDRLEREQQERETRHAGLARAALARFADAPTPDNLEFLFHPSYAIDPADLRKSILTLAVQGKLVPQDPNDEPANHLIHRILAEKDELRRKKLIRTTSAHTLRDVDIDDYELPVGWSWVTLDEISDIGTGSTPLKSQHDYYYGGTIPWVTSAATNNHFVRAPEQFVTAKAVEECNLRLYPKGSLLVALYGQGKTRGQIAQLMFDSTTNQACAVIVFFGSGEYVRDYVRLFFLKKYDELREQAAGGAQPNLSGGMIRLTRVPLPPLAEQRRIVAKVDQLMALVDQLETQLAASRAAAEKLLEALVAELTGTAVRSC